MINLTMSKCKPIKQKTHHKVLKNKPKTAKKTSIMDIINDKYAELIKNSY